MCLVSWQATGMDLDKFIASTPAQRWAKPTEVGEVGLKPLAP